MTAARAAGFISSMVIAASLWGFLNSAKNDVAYLSRSLIRQVRAAHDRYEAAEDKLAANERLAHVSTMFFVKYHFPEGSPERLQNAFEVVFNTFRRCDPDTVAYGDTSPRKTEDGVERPHRQVIVKGSTARDEPITLTLEWVQFKGSWYLDDYRVE
jgi:hypothetical protein